MTIEQKLQPVPFTRVQLNDSFWAPRQRTNREVTLYHIYQKLEETGRISAFDLNFTRPVPTPIVYIFGDSDPAKWIEATSYSLATHPDEKLEDMMDGVVDKIISAQQPDGYLNTHFTVVQPEMRWKNLRDWHEMYCAGHLIEGAVAHYEATGERKFIDALSRYADHIDATFGLAPGKKPGYPGHPVLELALVKLYRATGNHRYLELASYFVDQRGQQPHYYDQEARERGEDPKKFWAKTYEYCQAHVPVREQEKVVGHAVRAMYLYSAVADLAAECKDESLWETGQRMWDNLLGRRMYLTGGIGPSRHNEGFTQDYDLPDETAYAETCATIGLMLWNQRLLQFDGDRKFADVLERGLYNGFLSGIALDGSHFFYENPLSSAGDHHRQEWFECPCCPPNVARVIASMGGYLYSTGPKGLWVHLYAASQADVEVDGAAVHVKQETNYPWDGAVKLTLGIDQPRTFGLHLRIPGWCQSYKLSINGVEQQVKPEATGYLALTREWQDGDTIQLDLDMPIQAVWANPAVRLLEGRVALQRGPIVYCLEGVDNGGILLDRVSIDPKSIKKDFTVTFEPNLLGGVSVLHGKGMVIDDASWGDALYQTSAPKEKEITLTAIPYCVWDNREPGEMRVWLRSRAG